MLDEREEKRLKELDKVYEGFTQKGLISQGLDFLDSESKKIIPEKVQVYAKDINFFFKGKLDEAGTANIWKKVMKMAGEGFVALQGTSAKYTIDEIKLIKKMQNVNSEVDSFDKIYIMKSYEIEKIIFSEDWKVYLQTILQAAPTGAIGLAGIPFNIVLSTFIQFRTVQLVAMHYGYDVKCSQPEMDYASSVYLQILSKGQISDIDGYGELIEKMMVQAELSALRNALKTKSYEQMAREGGAQLLYVQLRAIANKAAQNALNKSGAKNIENQALKRILKELSESLSKKVGAKGIAGISALLSVYIDTRQIYKVMKISNVIYQKRFLLEKEMESNLSIKDDDDNDNVV